MWAFGPGADMRSVVQLTAIRVAEVILRAVSRMALLSYTLVFPTFEQMM
jgi:hypothetical protein